MTLRGVVVEVSEGRVLVAVTDRPNCAGCKACGGLLSPEALTERRFAARSLIGPVTVGETVHLDSESGDTSLAALLMFGWPLLAFFAGYAVVSHFGGSEGAGLAGGLAGMGCAALSLWGCSRLGWFDRFDLKIVGRPEPGAPDAARHHCAAVAVGAEQPDSGSGGRVAPPPHG